ncbi:MAG: dihydrofolate reductase [Pirellulaceae bacterium]|nr:MAG: dihydrofolate reductase [Pirellulaceae bacterium]
MREGADAPRSTAARHRRWILVAAVAQNGVIGRNNELPWRLSSDLRRFKRMTMGHCLLMGRRTFESIGKPLPGRQTVVLTHHPPPGHWPEEIDVVHDLRQVEQVVEDGRDIMVVGGARLYDQVWRRCDEFWITRVLADVEGDVHFPDVNWADWRLVHRETTDAGPQDQWPTEFQIWQPQQKSARQ